MTINEPHIYERETVNVINFHRHIKFYAEHIGLPFNSNITSSSVFECISFSGVVFVTRGTVALSSNLWFSCSNSQSYVWTYTTESKWWQLLHSHRLCLGNQIAHWGLLQVCDEHRLHDTKLSIFDSQSPAAAILNRLWQTEQKSTGFDCVAVLFGFSLADVVVLFLLLFGFDSLFSWTTDDSFEVGRWFFVLSVILLLNLDEKKTRKTGILYP